MTMKIYKSPIVMAEDYWANSHFSVARYTGQIKFNDTVYIICDKLGRDIFECSAIAEREGRQMAIEPGEPADLVIADWLPVYRAVGRERFLEIVKETNDLDAARAAAGIKKKGGEE